MFTLAIIGFILLFLAAMGAWQRRMDRAAKEKVVHELRDALHTGSNKAVGQFPHIDPFICIGCGSCIKACPENDVIGLINNIAHVIHAARCVGHGLCEVACPVGALKVSLGNIAIRPDIPVLSPDGETSITGLFIAGELGGLSLIRHALEQGGRVINTIADRLQHQRSASMPDVYDVLIVGAGPAGLAAGLRAIERKLNYLVISQDELGGTVRKYPRRKLTLVQAVEIPLHGRMKGREYLKEEIVDLWTQITTKFGLRLKTGLGLVDVQPRGQHFEITTTGEIFKARTVVLAIGRRGTPRKLGVAGEEAEKVMYQLIDADTYTSHHILVVGGGDSAIEAATGLANQPGNRVTMSYRKENFFRLKSRNDKRIREYIAQKRIQVLFSSEVESIETNAVNLKVEKNGQIQRLRINNNYVFVFAGGEVPFPLLKKIGIGFGGPPAARAA